ncbi:hypothetical protein NDU88_002703 [Pleurodeles waltl]|uniref:Uncharacterized protein n=1 Tax=Pleurodeles waltl TaxID=8319 RepID=A0AAV7LGM1_PLEWA|nr:hypothetical protein NDU88_002703 [Pleurodeles waltl]
MMGLQVVLFLSFEDLSPGLLEEWEQLLVNSSFGMMDILIRDAKYKRDKLIQEINILEKEMKDLNLPEATEKNCTILRKTKSFSRRKKLRKLKRDTNDYSDGRVFTYARKFDNLKIDQRQGTSDARNIESTSTASTSDTESSSVSSCRSVDSSNMDKQMLVTTTNKSPFLLELERYRKGQKQPRMGRQAHTRDVEEVKEREREIGWEREGVTTRSSARNQRN